MTCTPSQPLRADARRNHEALISAAAEVFARAGVDAPIKLIADRAGVGVGTVYRRFPKRSDLIVAVFRHEVDRCAQTVLELLREHPPFTALEVWIDALLDLIGTKRGLAAALRSDSHSLADLRDHFEDRLVPALERLMEAAGREITARVSAADLWRAIALLCAPFSQLQADPGQVRRMVGLLISGLRVTSAGEQLGDGPSGSFIRRRRDRPDGLVGASVDRRDF